MSVLIYLIPIAVFLGLLGLAAFIWALKSGQFDDMSGSANRILFDDNPPVSRHEKSNTPKKGKNSSKNA